MVCLPQGTRASGRQKERELSTGSEKNTSTVFNVDIFVQYIFMCILM